MVTRGRAADEPLARTASDGGSSSGVTPREVAFGRAPESPLGHTFAGWITLSDLISPSSQELSSTMRSLAAVLRSGIEYHTAQRFNKIRSVLRDAHLPAYAIPHVEQYFLAGHLSATPSEMAELTKQHLAKLARSGTISRTRPLGTSFLSSVIRHGRQAILYDGKSRLAADQLALASELSEGLLPATKFRVVASLEVRELASNSDFSIWCRKPLRWRGDSLVATEHTYTQRDICGLSNTRFRGHLVKEKYRGDIDEDLPLDFMESIDEGRPVDQYYYSYEITSQRRSRAERKMRAILQRSGHEIHEILQPAVEAGTAMAEAAATMHGIPIEAVTPLIRPFGRIAGDGIKALLLRDVAMTPWSITHTTLNMPEFRDGPLSMFTLISAAATTAKLHRVHRDASDPDVSAMDLSYDEKVRANQRGRGMIGLTIRPRQFCPSDLWVQVAQKNQPAIWTEPSQDNGGFRVLVPHAEIGRRAAYVSALRADVLRILDDEH